MKKIVTLIFGFLLISCSNDNPDTNSTTHLVAIITKYYSGNSMYAYEKLGFFNQKLTYKQISDGSHEEYQYSNNLVSEITEYDPNNVLLSTITYTYNSEGKIIKIIIARSPANPIQETQQKTITYNSNEIICICTGSSGSYYKYKYGLNADGEIISEKIELANGDLYHRTISYNYANNNLISFVVNDSLTGSEQVSNFTYTTLTNQYNYKKYLFGAQWKNNSFFSYKQQFGTFPSANYEAETSENLASGFSDDTSNFSFDYSFNAENQIIKQTQNYTNATLGINAKFESEYLYDK